MKVTLPKNGRKMTSSEKKQLRSILEKYFSSNTNQVTTDKVAQKPTEAEWFEVKPQDIDQKLFKNKRKDGSQEATRQLILEAFTEMKNNLEKYGKNFKTMVPKKEWQSKTVAELKEMACKLGDHNADWVEQALEWAQRIANGESWKSICNDTDTANWYRLVLWKNGGARLVGCSAFFYPCFPASDVSRIINYNDDLVLNYTVPLIVLYEE